MNRSWSGFLPQNEMVKLQWAAMEGHDMKRTVMALRALSRAENQDLEEETGSKITMGETEEQG